MRSPVSASRRINVPEEHGGLGSGPVETMLVMNALGEGLVLEPYLGAAVLTPALLARLNDAKALGRSVAGSRVGRAHRHRGAPGAQHARRAEPRRDARREERRRLRARRPQERHRARRRADELLVTARTSGKTDGHRRRLGVPRRSAGRGRDGASTMARSTASAPPTSS